MTRDKTKTLDGARTRVQDLNTSVPFASTAEENAETASASSSSLRARCIRAYKNLSLVFAGMYTGLNCYGTPHSERKPTPDDETGSKKPDNRPI